jgi:hypothetical protein
VVALRGAGVPRALTAALVQQVRRCWRHTPFLYWMLAGVVYCLEAWCMESVFVAGGDRRLLPVL